jgi:hypothetical protein
MILVGTKNGITEVCVSIDPDYLQTLQDMYPELNFSEQLESQPAPTSTPVIGKVMSRLEFRRLFTALERISIDNAPESLLLPLEARAAMRTMLSDLSVAEQVHLDDPDIISGVTFIASLGLIAQTRVAEILGT